MCHDLNQYCEFFYASHYVPIAIYTEGKQTAYYSSLDMPLDLSFQMQPLLTASKKNPDIFTLPEQGQYGLIKIKGTCYSLLIGPVFSHSVSENTILAIARNNFIPQSELESLRSFLSSIPNYIYNQFLHLIAYIHYSLNHETFDILEHFRGSDTTYAQMITPSPVPNFHPANETQKAYDTYQFENAMLSYIRDGEVAKLNDFLLHTVKSTKLREGKMADTPLRQAKNILLGLAALIGKSGAIEGGMDVDEAYRLIDLYNQECEKAPSVDAVKILQYNMVLDFAERVAQCKTPPNLSKEIYSCIQFMQNHTAFSIGINDVAGYIGKSRAWLTKKFRQECGLSVTEFITQSKLQDAKRLLRYSEKPLSEISNYLCFSSQAYFQTVFKKNTGLTPNEYKQKYSTHNSNLS